MSPRSSSISSRTCCGCNGRCSTARIAQRGYRHFLVSDPVPRKISAAPFRDRVVHHALCRVIEPLFDRVFLPHSFANREGKGTHHALARCRALVKQHPCVLKADVSKFFPSIDHEIMHGLLARRIRCAPTRQLIRLILDSGAGVLADEYRMTWFPGDSLLSPLDRARGLPIGNLTSQFWANVYLHELDRFVVDRLGRRAYVRYVDDALVFGQSKAELQVAIRRFMRRMRRVQRAFAQGGMPVDRVTASMRSWLSHAGHGQTYRLREMLLADLGFQRC